MQWKTPITGYINVTLYVCGSKDFAGQYTLYRMTTNFGEANIWRLVESLQLAKFLFGESFLNFNLAKHCFLQ